MLTLDLRTALLSHVSTDATCALVMSVLWWQNRNRYSGLGLWLADSGLKILGLGLVLQRGHIPDLLSIAVSNTLIIASAVALLEGLRRFFGNPGRQWHNAGLLAVFFLVHAWFSVVHDDLTLRTINISFAIIMMALQVGFAFLKCEKPKDLTPVALGGAGVMTGFCLVSLLRILLILGGYRLEGDYFHAHPLESWFSLSYQILTILQTFTLFLLVNRRLLLEVSVQEEKFSKAFRASPFPILLTKLSDGTILEANEAFARFSGVPAGDAIGCTTTGLGLWANEADRRALVERLISNKAVQGFEAEFRARSGKHLTGLMSAELLLIDQIPCLLACIADITPRKVLEQEREVLIADLQAAAAKVKTLSGILPICSSCKRIRDEAGHWERVEEYVKNRSHADFSHSICPECTRRLYGNLAD
ncbi:MAG TPA: PAS domain-containing protein [Candidatus Ozemobacteraceae bacterium]